jgi:ribosomal protein S18 acetylase RimI-like enzyme
VSTSVFAFLRAYGALSESCASYSWGTVSRNPTLPHVWDANRAWIYDPPAPSLGELREAIAVAQITFAVPFVHVEVVDTDACTALAGELGEWLGPPEGFVLMTTSGPPPHQPAAAAGMVVTEQGFPDRERWLELIGAGHADEESLPAVVLEEFALRDTGVLASAGIRFFTARHDDEVTAYASLLSLAGVGLIDNVATVPTHRRQGAATAVVAAVIGASTAAHNDTTFLFAREGGDAQRIYERLGLRVRGRVAQHHLDEPRTT